jgi:hypothetical protein
LSDFLFVLPRQSLLIGAGLASPKPLGEGGLFIYFSPFLATFILYLKTKPVFLVAGFKILSFEFLFFPTFFSFNAKHKPKIWFLDIYYFNLVFLEF